MQKVARVDAAFVHRLVVTQFPQFKDLSICQIVPGGWDNRTFRLGDHMLVRMPSAAKYAMQVEKEQKWLPRLAPLLPLSIPKPLAMGESCEGYPWQWSIYQWIDGNTAASVHIADLNNFATSLAQFLAALQRIDTTDGPLPGPHNFYRGGVLTTYNAETKQAIAVLKDRIDANAAIELWEAALASAWKGLPVWVHGDVSAGNLLVQEGKLSAVIDFGGLGIGDPACDLMIAWTLLRGESRKIFRAMLPLDASTWTRGRAWALWKALADITTNTNAVEAWHTINEVFRDYKRNS
ncbi:MULTISPECIES: aminoglycoside phosphotransferase family protein [Wolbachia]|nr:MULTISPECIES: aminoglycoside phosphotransferase family protein [unclassified Wolbachia]CQD09738.1 aminoglycoside phosphotransferase [Wolbachia endosymbiont wPip_Mol of Culex molestus]